MPGNVQNAAPATVMPPFTMSAFVSARLWQNEENEYVSGEKQTRSLVTTPRRTWTLTARVTAAQLATLRTFLQARRYLEPFYFYDGTETNPKWTADPTGAATAGRYIVVARGTLNQTMGRARAGVSLLLEEVA